MEDLTQIGTLSGYTLNLDKTEALILKGPTKPLWSKNYSFKWQSESLKYLGVCITRDPAKLYKENKIPYLKSLELTINTWKSFTLSYLGRANLQKMMEFPKLLYLLHSLPIYITPRDEKTINHQYRTFIWGGKKSRIAFRTMQQTKINGGINFPNICDYNLAALARIAQDWLNDTAGFSVPKLEQRFLPVCAQIFYIWPMIS